MMRTSTVACPEQVAARRLQHIVATIRPGQLEPVTSGLSPEACAQRNQQSIAEMEGAVYARAGGYKVTMYAVGDRGVSLAARPSVQEAFAKNNLEVTWAESFDALHEDTDIIVTTGAPVGRDVVEKCPKLALVASAFTGTDHVDVNACRAKGVTVCNIPAYATDSGAQLAIALVLENMNKLSACQATIQAGGWACPPQEDLASKKIGIVGTGSLGVRCAELFKAFNVSGILGYDMAESQAFLATGGTYTPSLAALFLDSDIIVNCMPLTEKTRGIISARLLQLLRPDSLLVTVGRGNVVDETAMATLLKERRFRAALDNFESEPLPADHPLRSVPSDVLTMTPHVGYQTPSTLDKRFSQTTKNILAFLAGQAINVVR